MADKNPQPAPLMSEPVPIFETFVTGVAEARDCGDFVRVAFYVDRPLTGTCETERAIVARLIIPRGAYGAAGGVALASRESGPCGGNSIRVHGSFCGPSPQWMSTTMWIRCDRPWGQPVYKRADAFGQASAPGTSPPLPSAVAAISRPVAGTGGAQARYFAHPVVEDREHAEPLFPGFA